MDDVKVDPTADDAAKKEQFDPAAADPAKTDPAAEDAAAAEKTVEQESETKKDALQAFLASSSPAEIFRAIDEEAKVLLRLIRGIPEGISHGYHTLAAEIAARKL